MNTQSTQRNYKQSTRISQPNHSKSRGLLRKPIDSANLIQVIDEVLASRWHECKGYKTLSSTLKNITEYFGNTCPITYITNSTVSAYVQHCLPTVKPSTINRRLSALKVLVKYAYLAGYTSTTLSVGVLPEKNIKEFTLSIDEYKQILFYITNDTLKDIFIILYNTGLRLSELLNLRVKDINLNAGKFGTITVTISKNGKPRTIPMNGVTLDVMGTILSTRAYNISDNSLIFPYTNKLIYKWWNDLRNDLHETNIVYNLSLLTLHSLRHSFITNLAKRGVPLGVIQVWAGHSTILTTSRYMHLSENLMDQYV